MLGHVTPETERVIRQFLGLEALILDSNLIDRWMEMLDPAIIYEVPLRIATRTREDELPEGSWRIRDDIHKLRKRLERLATAENWAENPPSRTVRTVGSIFIEPMSECDLYRVHSTVSLFRQRATDRVFDWIPARRIDLIREKLGDCALVRRTVLLAETILQAPSLSVFL